MKAKLIIEGKEFEVEIPDKELKKVQSKNKKTGYDTIEIGERYYFESPTGEIKTFKKDHPTETDKYVDNGNCYSSLEIAENNARANKLIKNLRGFAVKHREEKIDWNNMFQRKYYIYYKYNKNVFDVLYTFRSRNFGEIYFDRLEVALAAIDIYRDELIWYFTEYKDSL